MKFTKVIKSKKVNADLQHETNQLDHLIRNLREELAGLKDNVDYLLEIEENIDGDLFVKLENEIQEYAPKLENMLSTVRSLKDNLLNYMD